MKRLYFKSIMDKTITKFSIIRSIIKINGTIINKIRKYIRVG